MKYLIPIIFVLITALPAHAIDGKLYGGVFFASDYRAHPDGGQARFVSGVEIGQEFGRFRPYTILETLMDSQNNDGSFHPSSIKYEIGLDTHIWQNLYLNLSHMCWHPIDRSGNVEQYNLLRFEWRFGK